MKGFKAAYKSICHYYNVHESREDSFYISNMHWIYCISNQSFMNILHGYKLVRLHWIIEQLKFDILSRKIKKISFFLETFTCKLLNS